MASSEMPEATKIASVRDFKAVTSTKNRLLKGLKASQTLDAKVQFIQDNFPEALEEFTTIVFELSGLDDDIQKEEDLKFLGRLDFKAIFTEERIADSHIKEAKLISLVEKVDKSNEKLAEKVEKMLSRKSEKHALATIEKVRMNVSLFK